MSSPKSVPSIALTLTGVFWVTVYSISTGIFLAPVAKYDNVPAAPSFSSK